LGEKQAGEYGVRFLQARATAASSQGKSKEKRFNIETTAGTVSGRTVILAMGVTDNFPEFEGSVECIGKSMFWCILCDGYESIDRKVVVLGHNDRAAALALQLLVFTPKVTMVAGEESLDISAERRGALGNHGIEVHDCGCKVYSCETVGELRSIELSSGVTIDLDRLFVTQWIEPNTQLAKQLGVKTDEHEYILTDAEQLTNIPGVYAAGDITRLFNHQVTSAVHEGGMAAAAANYYLYEDWQKE
jgi:thioredoxin reductase (NADPH)